MGQLDDLEQLVKLGDVSAAELDWLLLGHFKECTMEGRTRFYPNSTQHAVKVTYGKHGNVVNITSGPALLSSDEITLATRLEDEILACPNDGVGACVLFCLRPVTGYWSHADYFQLLPVPASASRPPAVVGDHPFLLEFRYRRSTNDILNVWRRGLASYHTSLLLNGLIGDHIRSLGRGSVQTGRWSWVLVPGQATPEVRTAFCQQSYWYEGMNPAPETLSPVEGIPKLKELKDQEFYEMQRGIDGEPLCVPESLGHSVAKFMALDDKTRNQYLSACYWLAQADGTESASVGFLCAVQAIEALVPSAPPGERCEQCGLTKNTSRTTLFNQFLHRFAPTRGEDSGSKMLYRVRSDLSHGFAPPFRQDLEILAHNTPLGWEQCEHLRNAIRTARIALLNWLHQCTT